MEPTIKDKARLVKLAKQNNIKGGYTTLKTMFNNIVKELKEKGITENLSFFATNAIFNDYRRAKQRQIIRPGRTAPKALYGIVVGDMGMRDKAEEMRRDAKRYVDKYGIQAAQDKQLINQDNEVLDQRQFIYGKPNKNYLEPLNPNLKIRSRVIFAMFRKNGEKRFKFTSMQTSDNKLAKAWRDIRMFRPCQTFGIIKEEDDISMRVNSSQAEDTLSVFKALEEDWDVTKIIKDVLKGQYTKIQNVEKHYENYKDAWDRKIFLKGIVSWIGDKADYFDQLTIQLMDEEDEEATVRVKVPEHIPINFGELSKIIVMGRTRRTKYRGDDGELKDGDVVVTAFSLYPLPGLSMPKEAREAEALEDEEELEGWLQ